MKNQQHTTRFAFLLLSVTISLHFSPVKAQSAAPQNVMVQSAFYDAQSLYYALNGYNAYPIFVRDVQDATGVTIGQYSIVELTTGKVLNDSCTTPNLKAALGSFAFHTDQEKTEFINQLLARHINQAGRSALAKRITAKGSTLKYEDLDTVYKNNNYLNAILATKDYNYGLYPSFSPSATLNVANNGGNSGLPSVTTLTEGLAGFYIDRVNDEINDAFFVHLRNILAKFPELQILFPNTLASLNKIRVTDYQQSLNAIKSAYQTDIKNIMTNASGLARLEKYQKLINDKPALVLLFATCDMVSMIGQARSPEDILYQVGNAPYVQLPKVNTPQDNDYIAAIKLAAIVSNAFIDIKIGDENPASYKWVSTSLINSLKYNPEIFQLFMGLITQETYGIKIKNMDFYALLNASKVEVLQGKYLIYNFSTSVTQIAAKTKNLSAAGTTISAKVNVGTDIFKQLVNLATVCLEILPTEKVKDQQAFVRKLKDQYIPYLYQADSVIYHIEQKEYSSAIYAADTLIRTVLNDQIDDLNTRIKAGPTAADLKKMKTEVESLEKVRDHYLKYGTFIAAVAEANTGDDVKKAIQAFALPVGSSRIKKEHTFSWGLNSYVGLAHTWNKHYAANSLPNQETIITAPIGFDFNFALPRQTGSMSIYGGIIDIGAIFTYQVNNDKSIQSEIKLGQILSPSVGLVYGFPIIGKYNIPLSIGANCQLGPKLKSIDQNGASVLGLYNSRINLFIAIDIPIVNFNVSHK